MVQTGPCSCKETVKDVAAQHNRRVESEGLKDLRFKVESFEYPRNSLIHTVWNEARVHTPATMQLARLGGPPRREAPTTGQLLYDR